MPTVKITKKSVTQKQEGACNLTLNLQYLEKDTILIDQDFMELYSLGPTYDKAKVESIADLPECLVKMFLAKMQAAIDEYKLTQVIFDSPALDKAIAILQNELGV
jgi:hypothetical protein